MNVDGQDNIQYYPVMLNQNAIATISYPLVIIGFFGIIFCLTRDLFNIKKGRGRSENTAPEIYWFMMVLVVVGLFLGFDWKWALLTTLLTIALLHPVRKKTKLKAD